MGGKDCQCTAEADKVTKKSRYDLLAFLRVLIFTGLLLAIYNAVAYYILPEYYFQSNIFTTTNILIVLFVISATRTLFVGSCCLPDLQLSKTQIAELIQQRDVAAQQRILGKQQLYAKHLSRALQIPTISYDPQDPSSGTVDYSQLVKLRQLLEELYPKVHHKLERTIINDHSLIFKWSSDKSNPVSQTLKPYCLTAHLDVVPAPEPEKWTYPPFSGHIDGSHIWGRGAIDDKQNVLSILEAVEDILTNEPNFVPIRDIYLAFGHDEEIGGFNGAKKVAEHFQNTLGPDCFEFLCDEGLFIVDGMVPGYKKPVAFVCVAEKGSVTVELSVELAPGHASAPPKEQVIGILAKAVKAVQDNPFPPHFEGPAHDFLSYLGSGFSGAQKFIMTNLWLFAPIVKRVLAANPMTATMVRTTSALTIFKAGQKVNLLPSSATASINHRIHPMDSVEKVLEWDAKVINDPRVNIRAIEPLQPAPVSSSTHQAFKHISHAIYQTFDDICSVVPGMFVANSDSRWSWNLTKEIYRFNPILLNSAEVAMFHGFNEKIGIEPYAQLVFFWRNVIHINNDPKTTPRESGPLAQHSGDKKLD